VADRIAIRVGVPPIGGENFTPTVAINGRSPETSRPQQWRSLPLVVEAESLTVAENGQPPKTLPNPLFK
jgi:hypothetical protein